MSTTSLRLETLLGDYPQTKALKSGAVSSPLVSFHFAEFKSAFEGFKPMVREGRFDIGELAIVTYLQAKAAGKPYVLAPATIYARSQHGMIVYNAERGTLKPEDLPGKRVGVRSYTQTTGTWIRGSLRNDYGVDTDKVTWVTFEDPHLPAFKDPPLLERATPGKTLMDMLLAGEVDAAILAAVPDDKRLRPLFSDPEAASRAWADKHGTPPVNHLLVVRTSLSLERPEVVREVYRLLRESKRAGGDSVALPYGVEAMRKSLDVMIGYALQQGLIPRRYTVDELFDDTTRVLPAG
jgi:4,5-dihydroxyphthalate decarboxylase